MTRALHMSSALADVLFRNAVLARPLEFCAALLGSTSVDTVVVADVVRLTNCDRRPDRFDITDAELRRAQVLAAEQRLEIVALVHSHSSARAVPSDRDRAAISYSRYPWAIVGFDERGDVEVNAYDVGSCVPIAVVIEEQSQASGAIAAPSLGGDENRGSVAYGHAIFVPLHTVDDLD